MDPNNQTQKPELSDGPLQVPCLLRSFGNAQLSNILVDLRETPVET